MEEKKESYKFFEVEVQQKRTQTSGLENIIQPMKILLPLSSIAYLKRYDTNSYEVILKTNVQLPSSYNNPLILIRQKPDYWDIVRNN